MERSLATIEPFKRLPVTERTRLTHVAREKSYAKGETIFREGEPSNAVWVVKAGRVHLMKFLAEGKVSTTCVMTPGEMFCCLPALDRKSYPADAVAAEDSVVIRIPYHRSLVALRVSLRVVIQNQEVPLDGWLPGPDPVISDASISRIETNRRCV